MAAAAVEAVRKDGGAARGHGSPKVPLATGLSDGSAAPHAPQLESKIADTNSISDGSFGGAITAALFLQKFVVAPPPASASSTLDASTTLPVGKPLPGWVHVDLNGWTARARPGAPVLSPARACAFSSGPSSHLFRSCWAGFPEGGEPQGVRAMHAVLEKRYGRQQQEEKEA